MNLFVILLSDSTFKFNSRVTVQVADLYMRYPTFFVRKIPLDALSAIKVTGRITAI
jgi:hypothetical protein